MMAYRFREHDLDPRSLDTALQEQGGFFVEVLDAQKLIDRLLEAGRLFFLSSPEAKAALAVERSSHLRGWSQMHNERDWREQLHLGREGLAAGGEPAFRRLEGPNLWPPDPGWRDVVSRYIEFAVRLGERILARIASVLGVAPEVFGDFRSDAYVIAKLIGYHPQPITGRLRSGIAAHVDFSWLTVDIQDSEGLEVRRPDGTWMPIGVEPGVVWVHVGELLEYATAGRYTATPHRVMNPSAMQARLSAPVFLTPPLDAWVTRLSPPPPGAGLGRKRNRQDSEPHVHRVLDPRMKDERFHFGDSEWQRRGLGGWCFTCAPGSASAPPLK